MRGERAKNGESEGNTVQAKSGGGYQCTKSVGINYSERRNTVQITGQSHGWPQCDHTEFEHL